MARARRSATAVRSLRRLGATVAAAMGVAVGPAAGEDSNPQFDQYCSVCHGPDARGIDNFGVNLIDSAFVAGSSAAQLVEFLKLGRIADDPANVSGRPMPGFAWLSESELEAIAAFLKSRNAGG